MLVVSYAWPPRGGVELLRVRSFARYLPNHGWAVTILTPSADAPNWVAAAPGACDDIEADVAWAPWPHYPKRLHRHLVPDAALPWVVPAVARGLAELRSRRYDAVLSTSPPHSNHIVGSLLALRSGLPWLADLRDPWSDYHYRALPRWQQHANRVLERLVLARAERLVTVNQPLAALLTQRLSRPIDVIENGFDPCEPPASARDGTFVLRYFGKIHLEHQDPEPLFRALARLAKRYELDSSKLSFEIHLVGHGREQLEALAREHGLESVFRVLPALSHQRAQEKMASATLLPIVGWTGGGTMNAAVTPTKLYEALASGRPVLLVSARAGAAETLVRETDGGHCTRNQGELDAALDLIYQRHLRGELPRRPRSSAMARYTRESLAARRRPGHATSISRGFWLKSIAARASARSRRAQHQRLRLPDQRACASLAPAPGCIF